MPRRHCDGRCDPLAKERTTNCSTSSSSSPSSKLKAKRRGRLVLNRHPLRTQTLRRYQQKLVTMFLRYRRQVKRTTVRSTGSRQCAQGTTGERMAERDALCPARRDCDWSQLGIEDCSDCSSPRWSLSEDEHIFVSHSEEDSLLAYTLMQEIESEGFRCYSLERDFLAGHEVGAIDDALKRCRRIVLLLSRNYVQNHWCMSELLVSVGHMYYIQRALIVPVIDDLREAEVPACLGTLSLVNMRNDPNYHEKLMSNLKGPEVPVKQLMPFGNVSHGLVWSYYLRYLKIILPGLSERIDRWCAKEKCEDGRMPRKLYILVPASCHCPDKLKCVDERIHFGGQLDPVRRNSAGSVNRQYDLSVWNLRLRNEVVQFVGEYPATIDTLYLMDSERSAGLNSQMMKRERAHFVHTLRRVLEADGLNHLAELVEFDDMDGDGSLKPLSEILTPYVERDRLCSPTSRPP